MNCIKILLVDDYRIIRDSLRILLLNLPDIKIIGEAANAKELFILLKQTIPDIILMDISLPDMSGIVITEIISHQYPDIKVIMLTANETNEMVSDSFNAGAMGFLPKDIEQDELIAAIKTVNNGKEYLAKSFPLFLLKNSVSNLKSISNI